MQTEIELVTCVVPTYNRPQLLARCLDSIRNQEYSNIETIVVDNGIFSETQQVIQNAQDSGMLITHVSHGKTIPAFNNWLSGFIAAKSEFIKIVWDDDWLEASCISKLVKLRQESGADAVMCGAYGHVEQKDYVWYQQEDFVSNSFMETFPMIARRLLPNSPLAILMRRDDAIEAMTLLDYPSGAISDNLVVGPDLAMNFWALAKGGKLVFTKDPLVHMYGDGTNMTQLHEKIMPALYRDTLLNLTKHFGYKLSLKNRLLLNSTTNSRYTPSRILGKFLYWS